MNKQKIIKTDILGFDLNVIFENGKIVGAFTDEGGTYPLLEHEYRALDNYFFPF